MSLVFLFVLFSEIKSDLYFDNKTLDKSGLCSSLQCFTPHPHPPCAGAGLLCTL